MGQVRRRKSKRLEAVDAILDGDVERYNASIAEAREALEKRIAELKEELERSDS